MKVLRYFTSRYRAQSLLVLFCILLGGLLDGVGISAMLPVMAIAMRSIGFIAKMTAETIEDVDPNPVEAIRRLRPA